MFSPSSSVLCTTELAFKQSGFLRIQVICCFYHTLFDEVAINSRIIKGHRLSVNYCQFLNEDRLILSCSDDKTTKLWNPTTSKCIETFHYEKSKAIRKAHVNSNNCEICGIKNETVLHIVSECSKLAQKEYKKMHDNVAKFVNCGDDKRVLYWDMEQKRMIVCILLLSLCTIMYGVVNTTAHKSLVSIATVHDCGFELVHQPPLPVPLKCDFHKKTSTCLRFTQEDDKLVSTSFDGSVSVFDLRTNRATLTLTGHNNIVSCCALTLNDHFLVTGGWDKIVNIWDIAIGKYRTTGPTSLHGHEGSISCCVFGLEGKWLVTGGYDNLIILWDLTENREQYRLTEHINWVHSVDIGKSQRSILSCSRDRTVRIWDIDNISSISTLLPGNDFIPRILQCERCNKTFIPLNDYQNTKLLLCTYCKLDSCIKKYHD
eukprot:XP_014768092.1 PREDICTED: WD repeat-containing protein 88-like [Octopus bimaculoides]